MYTAVPAKRNGAFSTARRSPFPATTCCGTVKRFDGGGGSYGSLPSWIARFSNSFLIEIGLVSACRRKLNGLWPFKECHIVLVGRNNSIWMGLRGLFDERRGKKAFPFLDDEKFRWKSCGGNVRYSPGWKPKTSLSVSLRPSFWKVFEVTISSSFKARPSDAL